MKDSPATPSRTFRETEGDSPAAYFVTGTFAFSSSNHPADRGMDSMTTLLVATTGMSGPIRPRRDVKELLGPPTGLARHYPLVLPLLQGDALARVVMS